MLVTTSFGRFFYGKVRLITKKETKETSQGNLRVAFVLPHPDDEHIPLGLSAELVAMGCDVHWIALTKGDLGSHTLTSRRKITKIRRREFKRSAEIIGATVTMLPFHDGELAYVGKKAERRLTGILRDIGVKVVLTTSELDYHDDHRKANEITRRAVFNMPAGPIKTRRSFFGRKIPPTTYPVAFYSMDTQGSQQARNIKADDGNSRKNLYPVNMILHVSDDAINQSILAFYQYVSQLVPRTDGQVDYVTLAVRGAQRRGRQAGFRRGGGVGLNFEPSGGYAFSPDNVLATLFGGRRVKIYQ